ncbi:hypothetical protein D5086_021609 [Populus alba]|uniref:Uncharacterized protein n=1 Tax=Populus alba TaxID=43335 RepID=A0ACC4BD76_POPAL
MLMMFQLCQVMVILISFSSSITLLASDQLHPGEVNEDGQLSLKFVDSCQPNGLVKTELTSAPPNLEGNSTIECNCSITDDNYCHITSFLLKDYSLPGRLPPELANLTYVQKIRVSDNNLNGTVPEFIGNWTQLQKLVLYATGLQGLIPLAIFYLEKLSDLRIADMPGPEFQLPNVTIRRDTLVLRNINLTGTIPENAWKVETTLDLTFNKLVGEIPPNTIRRRQFTFLSGNKLTGTVQDPFLQNSPNLSMTNACKFMTA